MKLYCMRHGHAEQMPNELGQRPLSPVGVQELEKLAHFLAERKIHASHVMHSEKLRTKQTATIIGKAIAPEHELDATALLNPEKDIDLLLSQVLEWHDDTLLVGHMPFISQLVSQLVTNEQRFDLARFTPGTIVCLERCENQRWVVTWVLCPSLFCY